MTRGWEPVYYYLLVLEEILHLVPKWNIRYHESELITIAVDELRREKYVKIDKVWLSVVNQIGLYVAYNGVLTVVVE